MRVVFRVLTRLLWLAGIAGMAAGLAGCGAGGPIRVGFIAELTGAQSDLGVQGRNGALLAVETINAAGGINGRPLELVVKDDLSTPQGARDAAQELVGAEVVAIIGHMISGQALAANEVTESAGVVLLSPTASSEDFTARDDLFFRITIPVSAQSAALGRYLFVQQGVRSVALILDSDNAAFTTPFSQQFIEAYTQAGGAVPDPIEFASSTQPDYAALAASLQSSGAEGVLLITSPVDTALLLQQIHLLGWQPALFATSWAGTEALLQTGGRGVDGLIVTMISDPNAPAPAFAAFQKEYAARFGRPPTFPAALAYESVFVLAEGLKLTNGEAQDLPQALKEIEPLAVLNDTLAFDKFGDVVRPVYLVRVENGQFVTLSALRLSP